MKGKYFTYDSQSDLLYLKMASKAFMVDYYISNPGGDGHYAFIGTLLIIFAREIAFL